MFRKQNLVICTALLLLMQSAGTAQKKFCPAPPPSPFKHSGQIVTSFDSSSNAMRTTLEHPRPLGGADGLYLSATFVHQDPKRAARRTMELVFVSSSKGQRYRDTHDLFLTRDGRPVTLASAARYQTRTGDQGLVLEALRVTLSQEEAAAMAAGRKVTARVGGSEFELSKNHLEALREMATLMGGSSQRWRAE